MKLLDNRLSAMVRLIMTPAEELVVAWRDWAGRVPFESLDGACAAFIPLLHQRLVDAGAEDVVLERYKGVRRHTWVANQGRAAWRGPLLEQFQSHGIAHVVASGPALLPFYGYDESLRPLPDFTILVPQREQRSTDSLLHETDFTKSPGTSANHFACRGNKGEWLSLHISGEEFLFEGWEAMRPIPRPSVAWQFLRALRSPRWNAAPEGFWCVDAMKMAEAAEFNKVEVEKALEAAPDRDDLEEVLRFVVGVAGPGYPKVLGAMAGV